MRWSLLMRQLRPIQLHMLIAFLLIQDGDQCGEYHGPVLFFERTTWKYAVQKEWSGSRERAKLQTASSYSNSRHGTTAFCVSLLKTINLVGVSCGVRSIKLDDYTFEEFGLDERKLSSVCSWCCRELESFVFVQNHHSLTYIYRNQLTINTAIVYMHRFYMFHSFNKFHRNVSEFWSLNSRLHLKCAFIASPYACG